MTVQRIGVVLSTYNRPDALRAVLLSLEEQDYRSFEVVVADDGSGEPTRAVVEEFVARGRIPITHVWQADEGFRLAAIRNRGVAAAGADYLVLMDGDGVVRPDFLSAHARLAEPGFYVRGNSVYLTRSFTERVLREDVPIHRWGLGRWIAHRRDVARLRPLLRLRLGALRKHAPMNWRGAKTCNLGVWRADYLAVNGLDEAYEGWGHEDSDFVVRLIRHGVRHKDGRCAVAVLHLWHPPNDMRSRAANLARLQARLAEEGTWIERGVSQYLRSPRPAHPTAPEERPAPGPTGPRTC